MKLVPGSVLVNEAYRQGYAIGEFNVSNMEALQAVVEAANENRSPVIVGISNGAVRYAGWRYIHAMFYAVLQDSAVPITLHFDHAQSLETVVLAIRHGFSSVMIDASRLPLAENIALTKRIVEIAHAAGCSVEGEIGKVAGIEEDIAVSLSEANMTDPQEARVFCDTTGIDYLAISIGNVSGDRNVHHLDISRLQAIRQCVPIPLVLHGGSGLSTDMLRSVIAYGIAKVNIDTELRKAFTGTLRKELLGSHDSKDPRCFLGLAKEAVKKVVAAKLAALGSVGRA